MVLRTAAALIGIDGVDTPERASSLLSYVLRMHAGANLRWSNRPHHEVMPDALDALATFVSEFQGPAAQRRKALIERYRAGELTEAELPADILTIMLRNSEVWDEGLVIRDTASFHFASINTTAHGVVYAVHELQGWLERHREDVAKLRELGFLRAFANESLRLHPPVPFLIRRAVQDVTLPSGRSVTAGELLVIILDSVNRDPLVFGEDAEQFNPNRLLPARYPGYGLSFGAGRHTCIGKPLVTTAVPTSADDIERSLVPILRALIDAEVTPDPERAPRLAPTSVQLFEAYPVIFARL
jgi:cytochrome P450